MIMNANRLPVLRSRHEWCQNPRQSPLSGQVGNEGVMKEAEVHRSKCFVDSIVYKTDLTSSPIAVIYFIMSE